MKLRATKAKPIRLSRSFKDSFDKNHWIKILSVSAAWSLSISFALVAGSMTTAKIVLYKATTIQAGAETLRELNLDAVVAIAENLVYQSPLASLLRSKDSEFGDSVDDTGEHETPTAIPTPTETPKSLVANNKNWGPAASTPMAPPMPLSSIFGGVSGKEGQWAATKIKVDGVTAIYRTRVRADPKDPKNYSSVVWFDTSRLAFAQYAGAEYPEGNFDRGEAVPEEWKDFYVAGMAGAYMLKHSQGGYIYNGQKVAAMKKGKATLLTYPNGDIDLVKWGRDPVRPGYSVARQNIVLVVDGGVNQVKKEDASVWGFTWEGTGSGSNQVWRSGIGIRLDGSIVWVSGKDLSAKTLGNLLVLAGAQKAMALDMNEAYAHGFFYGPYMKKGGAEMNPDRTIETQFYNGSRRDYIAVFKKSN